MQLANTILLKDDPELIAKYKEYHANVWPEVTDALRKVGVGQMNIYIIGCRLIMVVDTNENYDPEVGFAKFLSMDPKCMEWEILMNDFHDVPEGTPPDQKWQPLENCFHLS